MSARTGKHITRPFELKSASDNGTFTGYGSVFDELDSYRDIVRKGAFLNSLQADFHAKGRLVPMLWQHETWNPIGVYTEVKEDDHGLYVEGQCNMDVQQGREAFALMKQRALDGLSIGYGIKRYEWDKDQEIRFLNEVKLYEISPVTFPAGDSARVIEAKAIDEFKSLADIETALCDAGYSRKAARGMIARIKTLSGQCEADGGDKASAVLSILKTIK